MAVLLGEAVQFGRGLIGPQASLVAENLFLRKQLAFYRERNITPRPTSSWTLQQLREAIPSDYENHWLIHDRSDIFSDELDRDVKTFGIAVLKTPVRAPKANAHCERLIGSLRRECLDWFILFG